MQLRCESLPARTIGFRLAITETRLCDGPKLEIQKSFPSCSRLSLFLVAAQEENVFQHFQHAADDYFLNSSDKIRVFFEEGALDKAGNLAVDKHPALNKIGHGMHAVHLRECCLQDDLVAGLHLENPVFKRMSFHPNLQRLVKDLQYEQPKIVQSMYIFKVTAVKLVSAWEPSHRSSKA